MISQSKIYKTVNVTAFTSDCQIKSRLFLSNKYSFFDSLEEVKPYNQVVYYDISQLSSGTSI